MGNRIDCGVTVVCVRHNRIASQATVLFFSTGLADIMKRLLTKYDNLFEISFPYSMGWHGKTNSTIMYYSLGTEDLCSVTCLLNTSILLYLTSSSDTVWLCGSHNHTGLSMACRHLQTNHRSL